MAEHRSQPRSTLLTNKERRLLVAGEDLLHAQFVLEAVANFQRHHEREVEQESAVVALEARPRRDIRMTENCD